MHISTFRPGIAVVFLAALCGSGPAFRPLVAADAIDEYCERVRKLDPSDAAAQYELGVWCRDNGLSTQSEDAFRTVVALDSDHLGARTALGFIRYGTGWIRKAELEARSKPLPGTKPKSPDASSPDVDSGDARTDDAGADGTDDPSAPATGAVAEVETIEGTGEKADAANDSAAALKEWAAEASRVFRAEFKTIENDEFLIHTTLDSQRRPQVQDLLRTIRDVRKLVKSVTGARSRVLWPEKLQIFLLRSPEEYERFADIVDGVPNAQNPDGAYLAEHGHIAAWKPLSPVLIDAVCSRTLEHLDGTDRIVGWWIRDGVAQWTLAQLLRRDEKNERRDTLQRGYIQADENLRSRSDDVSIYTLLETKNYSGRRRDGNRNLAMTLIDFLLQKKGAGFRKLLRALKSEDAPAPPVIDEDGADEEEAWKDFHLQYLAFQQEALEKFLGRVERLEATWVAHVSKTAEGYRKKTPNSNREERRRGSR